MQQNQQNHSVRPRAGRALLTTLAVATAGALVGATLASPAAVAQAGRWVTGAQVVDGSLASKDVKNGSLLSKDIRNGSVRWKDLAPGARRPGPTGPAGPQGPAGPAGAAGAAGVSGWELATSSVPPLDLGGDGSATALCAPGKKAVGGGVDGLRSGLSLVSSMPTPDGSGWTIEWDAFGVLGTLTGTTVQAICVTT